MTSVLAQILPTGDLSSVVDPSDLTLWDIIASVVVLLLGYLLARWGRRATRRVVGRIDEMPENITDLAGSIAFWLVIAMTVVFALSILGFDTAPVVLLLLFVVIILALSGRTVFENYGASLILQVRSPFEPGDQIQSVEHTGAVHEINGRTVVLHTMDGKEVHLPNKSVIDNPIVNLTRRGRRRSRLDVGVAYDTDLGRAQQVLRSAVAGVDGVLDDPACEVFVTEFDDSAINFAVRYWHEPAIREGYVVTDEVARAIDDALEAAGIVIAFPQATLWWGDPPNADPALHPKPNPPTN
jgi:small-conductance mechanosensitive channel